MPAPTTHGQRLAGKIALVTGAGSGADDCAGIGGAIARVMAAEGARVACVDSDRGRAENTVALVSRAGGSAIALCGDVSLAADCERVVATVLERWGAPSVLVNNVGINTPLQLADADEAVWRRVIDVNLTSAMLMSRAVLPGMVAAGGGSIVNIASMAGIRAYGTLAYGPSKAAMMALTREIAVLHGRDGIRVNSVSPGHMATAFVADILSPEARDMRRKIGPLGVEGDAWDVAMAVLFLASDEARFITAANLPVDGGVSETGSLTAHALLAR